MKTSTRFDFDLVVLGGGSGGVRAARMAADLGRRVALIEGAALGGTCVNAGCVPKKIYSYAAAYGRGFDEAVGYGWSMGSNPSFDWGHLKRSRAKEITRLNGVYRRLLDSSNVELIQGWGKLAGPHSVVVDGREISGERVIIATGGKPSVPAIDGIELSVNSDGIFDLAVFPGRLVVVGGGYIGCEFASIFSALGSQVTLASRDDRLIPAFDADVSRFLSLEMSASGLKAMFGVNAVRIEKAGASKRVHFDDGKFLDADQILFATGRVPRTEGLGLWENGVELSTSGAVIVDDSYRTNIESVYAVGDVTNRVALTPVALSEAIALISSLYGEKALPLDYTSIPTAVFSMPGVATVGLSEEEATRNYPNVRSFKTEFRPLRHTISGKGSRTFMKLVVDTDTDKVLGMHMVGDDSAEIIQGFAAAMNSGLTKTALDRTVGLHPTAAEEFIRMR